MTIDVVTSSKGNSHREGSISLSNGLASVAFPAVQVPDPAKNLHTGVSTGNAQSQTDTCNHKLQKNSSSHWYVLRTTYGREKKAYDYLINKGIVAFYPTITRVRVIDGKRKKEQISRFQNIFFVYGTEEEIKSFVYDNLNLPYLRFYYRYFISRNKVEKTPLIIPDEQIESLRVICKSEAEDIIFSTENIEKFRNGQRVRVIDGKFKGVEGTVARYQGQQRVGIVIDGLLTAITAYIPKAFIKKIETL